MGNTINKLTSVILALGLLCGLSLSASAQTPPHTVKGKVQDGSGEPIIGANVIVKGDASVGTFTDLDGAFVLETPGKDVTLAVSCIGFATTEVELAGRTTVEITMQPDLELEEVVVTALGIKREKKALGYAMQEVNTERMQETKSLSVANMLQGKVAGVQISQSGGGMGGQTRIVMRGLNSLSGNNQPLWIEDGMPINDGVQDSADQWGGTDVAGAASQINPEDIASISVLKGANAAALYGSRAQSGAIVVTTKKGQKGQPHQIE
jgi:TonB-dependent SusC/RagA subfamily outer membrane receptor